MTTELTGRQAIFVLENCVDRNATRAAIAAGYSVRGASVRGSELLRNPKVSTEIARQTEERCKKLSVSADGSEHRSSHTYADRLEEWLNSGDAE